MTQSTLSSYQDIVDRLQSGDLILFHGPGLESRAIEFLDQSSFSHVAMVVRLPDHPRPLLWSSDTLHDLADALEGGSRSGVHLLDLAGVLAECYHKHYRHDAHYRFVWRSLEAERGTSFQEALLDAMRQVDGRAFPSLAGMLEHFVEGRLGIEAAGRTFFCSELVAYTYVHLGLLPGDTVVNSLSPGSFAAGHALPLQDATLGPEVPFLWPVPGTGPSE